MPSAYPPLNLVVRTPAIELRGATDELLEALVPVVRAGVVDPAAPPPFDDPMSLYDDSPAREWRWLRAVWAGRANVDPDGWWRLYLVVVVDGAAVGVQDLIGVRFLSTRTVTTFSWLAPHVRGRGVGLEMRAAVLHLAFAGLGAERAESEAFADNHASLRISERLGYQPNGTAVATRRGVAATLQRQLLVRGQWERHRRADVELEGVEDCLPVLGLDG